MEEIQREAMSTRDKEEEEEAQVEVWKYIFGFVGLAVVRCAIELGIADAIESHGSPMTLSEISSTLGCDPSLLNRIMRFLTSRKIFKAVPLQGNDDHSCPVAYAQTPLSRRLMRNGEHSMAAFLLFMSSPEMLAPWHRLSARVLANGSSSFEKAHGEDLWGYFASNLDHSNLVYEAMATDTRRFMPALIQGCREVLDGVRTVVDVGGGSGTAMRVLVKACPWIRGINFDLPHIIAVAPQCDGVEHVAGDMFQSVPKADAACLMWVLHDWGDEESIQILSKCKEAIPKENGRVIIADAVIELNETTEGGNQQNRFEDVGLLMDMGTIAYTKTGKERTLKEWEYVIKKSGFTAYTVKPLDLVRSLIMAFP